MSTERWPALPFDEWKDTYATLHRWTQIVGKTRLALTPPINHWWHSTLYVSSHGLTTSLIETDKLGFEIEFNFIEHVLEIRTSKSTGARIPLKPQSVADFYAEYMRAMKDLGIDLKIYPAPVEIEDATPFPKDHAHASYDPEYANRFWRILFQAEEVFREFRGRFLGKSSPVHFFWGGFDSAVTRFSGRKAPPYPGGVPNCPNWVMLEAYSHEVISAGFWPGGLFGVNEPVFYAYGYPEPPGFAEAKVKPPAAYYHTGMREFVLSYDAFRKLPSPETALMDFLQSTYDAGADLGKWDRAALERAS